jgi:antitoxin component YwqK of YwqJK toxin-antitoxin module
MKFISIATLLALIFSCGSKREELEGVKTVYFPGTELVKQSVEYKDGKKNGYFTEYYRKGNLKARQFYINDTLDDTTVIYYPNGQLQTLHVYKNKLRHGCWSEYNKEGRLYSEMFFKEGLLDSTCSKYSYKSVRLLTRVRYLKGTKHGTEEQYYVSGKPKSRQHYFKGQLCKGTEEWYESGKKINHDFKIYVQENNATMLENAITYKIRLQDPDPGDQVYKLFEPPKGDVMSGLSQLTKEGDAFVYKIIVPKGGFVMEQVIIAAYRKTAMGNTVIKTQAFNVASNNF